MDAGRVIGSLRQHCVRLDAELKEIEADLANNTFMRQKYGSDFDEPVRFMTRLREAKQLSLKDAEFNLVTLVSTYEHSQRLLDLSTDELTAPKAVRAPWSTLVDDADGQLTVLTSSPILMFTAQPHIRTTYDAKSPNRR